MPEAPLVLVMSGCDRFAGAADDVVPWPVAIQEFPNRELHVEVPAEVAGRACVVVGSITPPAGRLARVTLVVHTLRRAGAARIALVLPYLAYARQDRAAATGSLGLAWVGELLRACGAEELTCVDVHGADAGTVAGLPLRSLSPAALLATALPPGWRTDVSFVAPDEGAIARCEALAAAAGSTAPVVKMRKRRSPAGIEHLGTTGAPGPRALVVDDILDTGATLVSCVHELRAAGVLEIGLVVTHGLFTGDRSRSLLDDVDRLWITDSVETTEESPKLEVVPVAPLLAPLLRG